MSLLALAPIQKNARPRPATAEPRPYLPQSVWPRRPDHSGPLAASRPKRPRDSPSSGRHRTAGRPSPRRSPAHHAWRSRWSSPCLLHQTCSHHAVPASRDDRAAAGRALRGVALRAHGAEGVPAGPRVAAGKRWRGTCTRRTACSWRPRPSSADHRTGSPARRPAHTCRSMAGATPWTPGSTRSTASSRPQEWLGHADPATMPRHMVPLTIAARAKAMAGLDEVTWVALERGRGTDSAGRGPGAGQRGRDRQAAEVLVRVQDGGCEARPPRRL